ncbi:MAG: RNA polymerase sigma factor [Alphaproteobacteria bacterium]
MSDGTDDDDSLLARIAEGEEPAYATLVQRHLNRVHALAYRMLGDRGEAEDVAQEAFLRTWRHAGRWTPGKARYTTWMHRVVVNLCIDRRRRRREQTVDELPDHPDPGPGPDAGLLVDARRRRVMAALAELPERQREAVLLSHYQELGNIEAAEVLGISVEAVESLLSRGRRALKALLKDEIAALLEDDQ